MPDVVSWLVTLLGSAESRASWGIRVAGVGAASDDAIVRLTATLSDRIGYALVVMGSTTPDLALTLRPHSALPVIQARSNLRLEADRIYVVPPGQEATVSRGELVVAAAAAGAAPFDRLLRSLADELGAHAAAILLSGPGSDGIIGLKRLKEAGGLSIVERPAAAIEGDVARAAIATGMVDLVLPMAELGDRLVELLRQETAEPSDDPATRVLETSADTLRDVLAILRIRTGHDFSSYKRATLYRRLSRRMQVCRCDTIVAYQQFLRDHPEELSHLLRDFLISVTNFFRDREAFEALATTVVPRMFAGKRASDQVRVWIAGCSTGEEAYSFGMVLSEYASQLVGAPQIQIFATDIDDRSLAEARAGRYPSTISADVSAARLARFFVAEGESYRVSDQLRELVLFSPHNLLRDPPFSRLDLVSCRNLLIYLNREAQDRVLNVFHFGLRPEGHLFLGSSESAENTGLFGNVDGKHRLFQWRPSPSRQVSEALMPLGRWPAPLPAAPPPRVEERAVAGALHHQLVEQYAPPSVLVNENLEILHLSQHAGRMLQMPGGEPSRQLLQLIRPALRVDLRTAIYAARQSPRGSDRRVIRFDDDGVAREIELRVRTVHRPELGPGALLVMFEELEPSPDLATRASVDTSELEPMMRELEEELGRTRGHLRTTIEQYETSVEELKASNEELQAINEELRSATEELETSKEELQSVNEELITLNHELKLRVDQISHANSDLQNLMTSTDIGVVFLDRELNIKRFTPRAQDLINVIVSDIGRPLAHLTNRLEADDLPELALTVLQTLRTVEREVKSRDGRSYLVRLLPYRSLEDRIEGVVLTLIEVTDLREALDARQRSDAARAESDERLRFALRHTPMLVVSQNEQQETTWGFVAGRELEPGSPRFHAMLPPGDAARFAQIAREVASSQQARRVELSVTVDGEVRTYDFGIERSGSGVSAVGFDVTASRVAELALREADRRKDEFLATLSHELRNPLMPLKVALDIAKLAHNDPVQLERSRGIMERQVALLGNLVDDLLDLSRIAQGKLQISRVPLDPALVVETALETTRPQMILRRHELVVRLPDRQVRVLGDQIRLTQVLTNLLINAARYTPDGGHIALMLEVDEVRKLLLFRVRDDGQGIAPDMLASIFDMFVQCRDDSGRSQGGLGIGLNLVQRLIALQHGKVSVVSDGLGRGSEFIVELPIIAEAAGT